MSWKPRTSRRWRVISLVGFLCVLSSCSSGSDSSCGSNISVSDYVAGFSQGLDNFSEDRYAQLRTESNSAYERTVNSVTDDRITVEATSVANKILRFITVMDTVDWDVNSALDLSEAVSAALDLGSELTLREANTVEGQLVVRCGLPSSIAAPNDSEITLPMNPIPSPTATDPITNPISDSSELSVIGKIVANQFGLSVTDVEAECLGESLAGIYDVSGSSSNNAQYQRQFQKAFDSCGIVFVVPNE